MPQRSNIPGGTAYSYAGKEGPKASSPVKQKPLQSSPTKGKGKSISGTSVNRKAAAQDAPPQAISTSASIRGTTLEKALKRLDKLITIGEKLRQSSQDSAWKVRVCTFQVHARVKTVGSVANHTFPTGLWDFREVISRQRCSECREVTKGLSATSMLSTIFAQALLQFGGWWARQMRYSAGLRSRY